MWKLKNLVCRLAKDESGAPATEYALMAAFIAIVMAAGAAILGTGLNEIFSNIGLGLQQVDLTPLPSG